MANKMYGLIVDDEPFWVDTFEKVLMPDLVAKKADSFKKANSIIRNQAKGIKFAVVDIRLSAKDPTDVSGLDILYILKSLRIPTVATSAYATPEKVRDAFVLGKVRNFWIKDEKMKLVELRDNIEQILGDTKVSKGERNKDQDNASTENKIKGAFWPFFGALVGFPIIVFSLLAFLLIVTVPKPMPISLVGMAIGFGVVLVILLIAALALFINKISGKQFLELVKEVLHNKSKLS